MKKRLFFVSIISLLIIYIILLVFDNIYNFSPFLISKDICQTYYMITFVTISAISYILDTIKKDRDGYLTLYLFPVLVIGFLFIDLLVMNSNYYDYILLILLLMIWLLLDYFVVKKHLLMKINMNEKLYFWSYVLYYIVVLTLSVVISFFILNQGLL